jgi:hypothetical protein
VWSPYGAGEFAEVQRSPMRLGGEGAVGSGEGWKDGRGAMAGGQEHYASQSDTWGLLVAGWEGGGSGRRRWEEKVTIVTQEGQKTKTTV